MKRVCSAAALLTLIGALALTGCWNPFRSGRGKKAAPERGKGPGATAPAGVELSGELKLENLWDLEIKLGKVERAWVGGAYAMVATRGPNLLYLLRLRDGFVHWICQPDKSIETAYPPAFSKDAVMIVSDNRILRIDRASGELVCVFNPGLPISARPVLRNWVQIGDTIPVIYAPSYDGRVWSMQVRKVETEMENPVPGQPPIKIVRYAPSRGWSTGTPRGKGQILAPLSAAGGGFIYACTTNGYIMGLKESTGRPAWRLETQGQVEKGVSISKDRLYFGSSDFKLYCVNRLSGEKLWTLPTGSVVRARPLADAAAKLVVSISQGQGLFGVETDKGRKLWQNKDVRQILGIGKKAVYAVSRKGQLLALDKKTGQPVWRSAMAGFRTVFPNDAQYEKAEQPLYLMAVTKSNEIVCLVEPGFRPAKAGAPEVKKVKKPTIIRVIKGKGGAAGDAETPAPAPAPAK